jgi:hypothetical protein
MSQGSPGRPTPKPKPGHRRVARVKRNHIASHNASRQGKATRNSNVLRLLFKVVNKCLIDSFKISLILRIIMLPKDVGRRYYCCLRENDSKILHHVRNLTSATLLILLVICLSILVAELDL